MKTPSQLSRSRITLTFAILLGIGSTCPALAAESDVTGTEQGDATINMQSSVSIGATTNETSTQGGGDLSAWARTDCTSCHDKQQASFSETGCLAADSHAALAGSCITCHADTPEIQKVHEKAKPEKAEKLKKLRKTTVNEQACLDCHGGADKLAKATKSVELLTDNQGTTVNPHDLPTVKDHEKIGCESCHNMHDETDTDAKAVKTCAGCHHAGVYECGTCHD